MPQFLKINLLGTVSFRRDGHPIPELDTRKTAALLAYLAITGVAHSRSALAGLLWGDMPEAKARGNLSKAISTLRHAVGNYLTIGRQSVAFKPDSPYRLDVAEFEHGAAGSLVEKKAAIALYRGDFLADFRVLNAPEFETWALARQARLKTLALDTLHTLSAKCPAPEAIRYASRALEIEPWREAARRQLMRLLAQNGQRGAALAQFETCRAILAEELAAEPSPETVALAEQIRAGTAAVAPSPPSDAPLPDFLSAAATSPENDAAPFVARHAELQLLEGRLDEALAGHGQVFFLSGGAGAGKSALAQAFSRRAADHHPNLLAVTGRCNAYGGIGDPYLPFREILNVLTGDVETRWRAGDISTDMARRLWEAAPQTTRLLAHDDAILLDVFVSRPALARRAMQFSPADALPFEPSSSPAPNSARAQSNLFDAFTAILHALARRHPLLLMLDDLHWADAGSISLLFHLGRRLAGHKILLVGAFRPAELTLGRDGKRHPLEPVIHEFQRLFGHTPIGLQRSPGRNFIDNLLDSEPNALENDFRAALVRHTEGQPLFAIETLRGMQERGELARDADGRWVATSAVNWDTLPARVEGIIAERMSRLPENLRATLNIAAVEGETFTAEVGSTLQGLEDAAITGQLGRELGQKHRLVVGLGRVRHGDGWLSQYRFRHILFQKYLYQSMDEIERAHLHEQIGYRLEKLYSDDTEAMAGQLARHFEAAGLPKKALPYWRQAGDAAAQAYANTEAIAHYRRALALADAATLSAEALTELNLQLGRALELDSQFEAAQAAYRAMENRARERADARMELAALTALMTIQAAPTAVHAPAAAQALGSRALALARQLDDQPAEAKLLWILSLAYYFNNQLAQAIEYGETSLALARRLNLREQLAQTLNDLGSFCYMYSGHLAQAKTALHEAAALWREIGNRPMLADSLSSVTVAHVYAGEFAPALAHAAEADSISRAANNVWGQSYSRWKTGLAHWEMGEFGRALDTMEESIRLAEQAGFLIPQTNTRADLAVLLGEAGAVERGLAAARQALSIAEGQNPVQVGPVLGALARLQLLQSDDSAAETSLARAAAEPYRATWPVFFVPVDVAGIELHLLREDFTRAETEAARLLAHLRGFGMAIVLPHALYLHGQAMLGLGKANAAETSWREALSAAEAIGSRRMAWRIAAALARIAPSPAEVESLNRRARDTVAAITAGFGNDRADLCKAFLAAPAVRAIFRLNTPA